VSEGNGGPPRWLLLAAPPSAARLPWPAKARCYPTASGPARVGDVQGPAAATTFPGGQRRSRQGPSRWPAHGASLQAHSGQADTRQCSRSRSSPSLAEKLRPAGERVSVLPLGRFLGWPPLPKTLLQPPPCCRPSAWARVVSTAASNDGPVAP